MLVTVPTVTAAARGATGPEATRDATERTELRTDVTMPIVAKAQVASVSQHSMPLDTGVLSGQLIQHTGPTA